MIFFLSLFYLFASTVKYNFQDLSGRDVIQFEYQSALDFVVGINHAVSGYVEIEGDLLSAQFLSDVRLFETGTSFFDEFIKTTLLNAKLYPEVEFKVEKFKSTQLKDFLNKKSWKGNVKGVLKLNNIKKEWSLPSELQLYPASKEHEKRMSGNLLKVTSRFKLNLSDFGITKQDTLFVQPSNQVDITFFAVGK